MKSYNEKYKGLEIKIRVSDSDETIFIDNRPIKYGQLPDGSYFLEDYAYDWKDNLEDLAKAFIDYQDDVKNVRLKKRLSKNDKRVIPYRKNYRKLTTDEKNRFAQALHHVKSAGLVDDFANLHATHFFHTIHRSSHFLPWHREFLRRFEDGLRSFDSDITIPYWNSTEDFDTSDPLFWANDFLLEFDSAWGLDRALGSSILPDPTFIQQALIVTSYSEFRVVVEGPLHGRPHNWVGGKMATTSSPADPVFWLHHSWIDLIWAQWQLLHPNAPFEPGPPGTSGVGLNDPLMGWTTTPADVLDHRTINLYDFPPGFEETDLPIVTPSQ